MSQIYGVDVSHWQGTIDWTKVKKDFVVLKCTEGTSYKDLTYESNKRKIRKTGMAFASYHFAKGGNAKQEAQWFYKSIWDWEKGEFLVLDFEIKILNPVAWCLTFLKEVERLAGFKPLIYLDQAHIKASDWTPVVKNNNGLWAARYGLNLGYEMTAFKPATGAWGNYAMWQYSSRGRVAGINGFVDVDVFQGSVKQLKKYGKK